MSDYKTPLRKARGLGSAKSGAHHFIAIRFSAILLVPLILWFVYAIACLGGADLQTAREFIAHPVNATMLVILLLATFHHSALGMQVIFEDYIAHHGVRLAIQTLFNICCLVMAAIGVVSVLKLAFSA